MNASATIPTRCYFLKYYYGHILNTNSFSLQCESESFTHMTCSEIYFPNTKHLGDILHASNLLQTTKFHSVLSLTITKLCHIKREHLENFYISLEGSLYGLIAKYEWPQNSPIKKNSLGDRA